MGTGDLIVAVNDVTDKEMMATLQAAKKACVITVRKPRVTGWANKHAPQWEFELSEAPRIVELMEKKRQQLMAVNGTYTERGSAFDVNECPTYWSYDGGYYIFYNSLDEWSVGTTDHFDANKVSKNGRRFALIVDSVSSRDILSPDLLSGWLQWDVLSGLWVHPPDASVQAVGWTKKVEPIVLTVKVQASEPKKVKVPYSGRLALVTTELKKTHPNLTTGKTVKYLQGSKEYDEETYVARVDQSSPLVLHLVRAGKYEEEAEQEMIHRTAAEYLKIPHGAIFVNGVLLGAQEDETVDEPTNSIGAFVQSRWFRS